MTSGHLPRLFGAAVISAGAILCSMPAAPAFAAPPCPDAELIFARGTGEAPGVGGVGQSLADQLRGQLGARTVDVYPVDYPASDDFANRDSFAAGVIAGVKDAGAHVQSTAANCPNTKIVLGGYSQGAAVAGFVTASQLPAGVPASVAPRPLQARVASHVAAVTLFGTPSPQLLQKYDAPALTIGGNYVDKTLKLCADGDSVCDGSPDIQPSPAHLLYPFNGMTSQAATYATDHIAPAPALNAG